SRSSSRCSGSGSTAMPTASDGGGGSATGRPQAPPTDQQEGAPARTVNILMVDDHEENLLALEEVLNGPGRALVRAASGRAALTRLFNDDSAVILLDVQMPEMDGFEAAALIRERERSQHPPIIFMTAVSVTETQVFKGYSIGAVDYILKPIAPEV